MSARVGFLLLAALAALAVAATPTFASLADEVFAGKAVAAQRQAGEASCATLNDGQFEHLGAYVMDRMAGSPGAHAAMNERMEQAIGAENADRMHELMGRRFAGCGAGDASSVPMGPGLMGGGRWGAMMGASAWGWMHNGSWQHMSSGEWRNLASLMMGTRSSLHSRHRWSTGTVVMVVLGALLVGALLAVVVIRRPRQNRPPAVPGAA